MTAQTTLISRKSHPRRVSLALTLTLIAALSLIGCRAHPNAEIISRRTQATTAPPPSSPTPTPTPLIPTPHPTRVPPESTAISYTVRPGDTLSGIAIAFGTTPERLMEINGLLNGDMLAVGQVLQVTLAAQHVGPEAAMIPDSEAVYGPSYADFDLDARAATWPGLFGAYTETISGVEMSGPEIVQQIAEQYGVGPRVLLALLELRGGWLSDPDPDPTARTYPLGYTARDYWDGLHFQLSLAANALNIGFYGWMEDDLWLIQTEDGTYIQFAPSLNAGTASVQRALAAGAEDYAAFVADVARFDGIYRRLFGDPFARTVALIPPDLEAPEMALPWPEDETWYYTGGPHGGWGTGSAWAALDFVSDERDLGCMPSRKWATASASGPVIISREGEVWQDLDGDGFLGTGWVVLYMHLASEGRPPVGAQLEVGDKIGHISCEGGVSTASHLHIARRYNGVWIAADDPRWPMALSGWAPASTGRAYNGTLTRDGEVRTAKEDWTADNAVRH